MLIDTDAKCDLCFVVGLVLVVVCCARWTNLKGANQLGVVRRRSFMYTRW